MSEAISDAQLAEALGISEEDVPEFKANAKNPAALMTKARQAMSAADLKAQQLAAQASPPPPAPEPKPSGLDADSERILGEFVEGKVSPKLEELNTAIKETQDAAYHASRNAVVSAFVRQHKLDETKQQAIAEHMTRYGMNGNTPEQLLDVLEKAHSDLYPDLEAQISALEESGEVVSVTRKNATGASTAIPTYEDDSIPLADKLADLM